MYVYDSIWLNCSYNEMFQTKAVEKIRTRILFSIFFFFFENRTVYERMWKKYHRAGQATEGNVIRHKRFACWITLVTNTRLEYVILTAFHGNTSYANVPKYYVNMYTTCLVKISARFIYFQDRPWFYHTVLPRKEMIWLRVHHSVWVSQCVCVCVCVFSLATFEHVSRGSSNYACPVSLRSIHECEFYIFPHYSDSVKGREFLDHLSDSQFLKQTLLHGVLQSVSPKKTN